ncbi:MAG: hypothetical protein ISS18_15135 [Bacteroidales bacterium]|nr:hypothetical protein [Bacteroidales bacterium]
MYNSGGYVPPSGAAHIIIDGDRAVNLISDGETPGGATMSLADFITAVVFSTLNPQISTSGGETLELGDTTLAKTIVINVTKPAGCEDIDSIVVTSDQGYNSGDIKTGTGSQNINHAIVGGLTQNQDETFTATVTTTDSKTATDTEAFVWHHSRYWGKIDHKVTITDADILALTGAGIGDGDDLTEQINKSFDGMDMASEYFIYAFKSSFGAAIFKINGLLNGDFTLVREDSFINQHSYAYTIKCYVSNNVLGSMVDFDAELAP